LIFAQLLCAHRISLLSRAFSYSIFSAFPTLIAEQSNERGHGMTNPQRVAEDEPERIVLNNIADYGWHCVNIIEDDGCPPWSFTIGLYESYGFPELIVIGRSRATAHAMLNTLADDIEMNDPPDLTDPDGHLLLGMKCHFLEVHTRYYSDYVGFAKWFYRKRSFPLYQIVWQNDQGRFPWDPAAGRSFKEWQPVLGGLPCARG
jgi:hypothetical protein